MGKIELKPHNIKPRNKILEAYKNGIKTVVYVAGVGLGKSYVFMGVLDEMSEDTKVLYVLPKHVIKENLYAYRDFECFKDQIDFVTFNYFTGYEKGMNKISGYDLIVIDECHHIGSELYGRTLLKCMQDSGKKVLGLTATPFRDTDKTDVSQYFEKRIDGLSNFDAIRAGIMPEIIYEMCIPEQSKKEVEKDYEYAVKGKIDYLDSSETVKKIINKYPRNKWICFFPDTKSLQEGKKEIQKIFKGYKILTLYAKLGNLKEVVEELKQHEKVVILSVNILLEGVHFDSVDGICLYRNVSSISCFQQMIGRICSTSKTINPVIIDCSRSGEELYLKLIYENRKHNNQAIQKAGFTNEKDIIRIGINGSEKYDVNKVLERISMKQMSEEKMKENTQKALVKYRTFKGGEYKSLEKLRKNSLDYKKMTSCAKLYKTTINRVLALMNAES